MSMTLAFKMTIARLSGGEINLLKYMASLSPQTAWGRENEGDVTGLVSVPRLLDKELIRVVGQFEAGYPAYQPTPLGYVVAKLVDTGLHTLKADAKMDEPGQAKPDDNVAEQLHPLESAEGSGSNG